MTSHQLHQFDPVRIIWVDSYTTDDKWVHKNDVMNDMTEVPLHETVGLFFGESGGCLVMVQSRGVAPGFNRCDQSLAIPVVSVVYIELLETGDVVYEG